MYAMNIQNDVIGLVLRNNCKSKQVTEQMSRKDTTREMWLIKRIFRESWWVPYLPLICVCRLMFVCRRH